MPTEIIVAVIVGGLALMGNVFTSSKIHSNQETRQEATIEMIRAENKATYEAIMYRIGELEKKQDKHNKVIERLAKVEQQISSGADRLNKLETK